MVAPVAPFDSGAVAWTGTAAAARLWRRRRIERHARQVVPAELALEDPHVQTDDLQSGIALGKLSGICNGVSQRLQLVSGREEDGISLEFLLRC